MLRFSRPARVRMAAVLVFGCALTSAYLSSARAQRSVPPLGGIRTEEDQTVAMPRSMFQQRELAKRLPLDEPWPAGSEYAKAVARFGLQRNPPPATLPMPSRITTDVYLIGQDRFTNLTYLVDCGPEGVVVIDPTYESEVERTMANVESCGRPRKDIRWVINTHCHTDHAWADRKFHEAGAEILIHEADAAAVEKGTQVTLYSRYKLTEFPRCPVGRRLSDGENLQLGNKTFLVIHTPGHTPGSASFLLRVGGKNLLFAGDTVFYDYMIGFQSHPYADNHQYLASLRKLEAFAADSVTVQWDVLLPGHGSISLDKAHLDVRKTREHVERELAAKGDFAILRVTPDYRKAMFGRPATIYQP